MCARACEMPVEAARELYGKVTSHSGCWSSYQMDVGEALNVCYEDCKKEGEEIVFECVISGEAECDREKHSVFYMAIIAHPTSLSRQERDFPTTTR